MSKNILHNEVIFYPLIGLSAIRHNNGGAWRAWLFAQSLSSGEGKVNKKFFLEYLDLLGVHERTQRRWIKNTKRIGLLTEYTYKKSGDTVLLITGKARAAIILGCYSSGKRSVVYTKDISKKGWKGYVWAAYVCQKQMMSQATREEMTGIKKRTQRNYQKKTKGSKKLNFIRLNGKYDPNHANGIREITNKCVYKGKYGQLIQRLPDTRIVPKDVARPYSCGNGRDRAIQKRIDKLVPVEREQCYPIRLFNKTDKEVKNAKRTFGKIPPEKLPQEIFIQAFSGNGFNRWEPITIFEDGI